MNVELIDYTGAGSENPARFAANILVFTKQTRLNMDVSLMEEIASMNDETLMAELRYMANTIPSSWEFVNYTFLITNVTRAFTHQFVRTRTGSYAQQTMRILNVDGWTYGTGPTITDNRAALYHQAMADTAKAYNDLVEAGAAIEDARGVLPTNIHTNIVAKFDLRTLCDLFRKRASGRTQGEYRDVLSAMKAEVLRVHPWTEAFIIRTFDAAASDLEAAISAADEIPADEKTRMIKLLDQMRTS